MKIPTPTVYIVEVGPALHGLRNPTFLPVVGELFASIRQMIARAVRGVTGGDEARAHALAAVVLACFDGLALQQRLLH